MTLRPCPLCGPPFETLPLTCAMCFGERLTDHAENFVTDHFKVRDLARYADHSFHLILGDTPRVWTRPATVALFADTPARWTLDFRPDLPLTPADAARGEPVTGVALSDAAGRLVARRAQAFGNFSGGEWKFSYTITINFSPPGPPSPFTRFRKRPVEVEAARWDGPWVKLPGVFAESAGGDPSTIGGEKVRYYVVTIHGQKAYLAPGDWVIVEPNEINHYPCKDEVFRRNYERA